MRNAARAWALAAALVALAHLPSPAAAQSGRSLTIPRFDVDLLVRRDGTLEVTERIRFRFRGSWNGIFRNIPVEYIGTGGVGHSLFLDVLSVTDEAGSPLRYESNREGRYRMLKVWVPGAQDAERTVVLRYRVANALRFFDESDGEHPHDELYWNVTGNESDVPIEVAMAHVYLPPGVTGLRATAFTGPYGSRESAATVDIGESDVIVTTARPLGYREGLTVVVGWDPGVVARPTAIHRAGLVLRGNWMLALPLLVFAVMYAIWSKVGRDPRLRPIAVRYEPPEGLTPCEVGTLVDNRPDVRDITATIVDLAVRGFLTIEERSRPRFGGLSTSMDYVFRREPRSEMELARLAPHERTIYDGIFDGGDSVRLSTLENEFYRHLPEIRDWVFGQLIARGYYRHRPDRVRAMGIVISLLVVGFIGMAALGVALDRGHAPLTAFLALGTSLAIAAFFGYHMPARTRAGARALEHVLGFEEFLRRVERDRLERTVLSPATFEAYLPHAMALGLEKRWARAFEDIYTAPPRWYQGRTLDGFRAIDFVDSLGRMSTRAAAAMTSAPRSAGRIGGSSGFSVGGGFSGGGFGGGSVGGF